MKDTIKNSIIGAFAIFGFITLISSSNINSIAYGEKAAQVSTCYADGFIYETVINEDGSIERGKRNVRQYFAKF